MLSQKTTIWSELSSICSSILIVLATKVAIGNLAALCIYQPNTGFVDSWPINAYMFLYRIALSKHFNAGLILFMTLMTLLWLGWPLIICKKESLT